MNTKDEDAIWRAAYYRRWRELLQQREDAARVELPRTFAAARKEKGQLLRRLWRLLLRAL